MSEFREYLFKDLNISALNEAADSVIEPIESEPIAPIESSKKEFGKIGEQEIKKIFKLKSVDVDSITKNANKSSVDVNMFKEKLKYEKSIDDIADALGASSWSWSGDTTNPFKVTFNW
jgi:hypothetical protein